MAAATEAQDNDEFTDEAGALAWLQRLDESGALAELLEAARLADEARYQAREAAKAELRARMKAERPARRAALRAAREAAVADVPTVLVSSPQHEQQ